jgi:hypothetical protein
MTGIDSCPACGYPRLGPGLCAFCQLAVAVDHGSDDVARPPVSRSVTAESSGSGAAAAGG